jgi:hypothetical protein
MLTFKEGKNKVNQRKSRQQPIIPEARDESDPDEEEERREREMHREFTKRMRTRSADKILQKPDSMFF